jgi:hypothetical protein
MTRVVIVEDRNTSRLAGREPVLRLTGHDTVSVTAVAEAQAIILQRTRFTWYSLTYS